MFMTIPQAAIECHVSEGTIRAWIASGLATYRPGLETLIVPEDLLAHVRSLPRAARLSKADARCADEAENILIFLSSPASVPLSPTALVRMACTSRRAGWRAVRYLLREGRIVQTGSGIVLAR